MPNSRFPRTFWVANVMELFERAAYYGLNSVLAIYLTDKVAEGGLGFDEQSVGFLQGIVYAANYVVPILGGALADRYGYRRMLMFAFSLLATGYFAAGYTSTYALIFLCLLISALGAGLFKPIISGTIARTTTDENSALGFGIYYWMINIGATVAPLIVTWLKGFSWQMVFTASAAYTAAMLLPAAFVYREPEKPANTKTIRDVLVGAAEVLGDARFMLMIVVYSGFWILYFQNFSTVLYYLRDFIDKAPVSDAVNHALGWLHVPPVFVFAAEHVTVINGLTIILLQLVVSAIVRTRGALPTMVTGMGIGALGFTLLAVSQNPWIFIAGISVFSIGEMTAHPKYYSFIGIVAPPDRKAVYMGYAFLYGVFGTLIGVNLGSTAYQLFLKPAAGTPDAGARAFVFWIVFAIFDVGAAIGLIAFAKAYGEDTPASRRGAAFVMRIVYLVLLAVGLGFLGYAVWQTPVLYKMAVQSLIFIALGIGGLLIGWRTKRADR